ncbi:MAG: pro-sigmaK processing inhibitor BofA family protein [Oscillospiraceae bacterium]|jgi:pro-sigmaK processing inhibitor BofA|nr:Pro-sigmaK processing inhibitor BofA [Oscillospiraceae bacterium]MDE6998489.1 pro-sigmaK processing inhibitor BofA family protein [Oscillospiraceae bacterium]
MMPVALLILTAVVLTAFTVRSGLDGGVQAAVNAVLGLGALLAVNLTAVHTGVHLGFNLFNAAVAGVLGVPGVVLLALVQWIFA